MNPIFKSLLTRFVGKLSGSQNDTFDEHFYRNRYLDLKDANIDLREHYLKLGRNEGRFSCEKELITYVNQFLPLGAPKVSKTFINPLISIVIPVKDTPPKFLCAALDSLRTQDFKNWEACIVNDASSSPEILRILKKYQSRDRRIRVMHRKDSGHISIATNDAIAMSKGTFIGFMDHDDELTRGALAVCANSLIKDNPDVLYSDEIVVDQHGKFLSFSQKPDFSPSLLNYFNYICHFVVVRKSILETLGGLRAGYEGSQDHDLLLRLRDERCRFMHLPFILYKWRSHANSVAGVVSTKPYAQLAGLKSVNESLQRLKLPVTAQETGKLYRYGLHAVSKPKIFVFTREPSSNLDIISQCEWVLIVDAIRGQITDSDLEELAVAGSLPSVGAVCWANHGTNIENSVRFGRPLGFVEWEKIQPHFPLCFPLKDLFTYGAHEVQNIVSLGVMVRTDVFRSLRLEPQEYLTPDGRVKLIEWLKDNDLTVVETPFAFQNGLEAPSSREQL